MRLLVISILALLLFGCTGDRIKQNTNLRQLEPSGAAFARLG